MLMYCKHKYCCRYTVKSQRKHRGTVAPVLVTVTSHSRQASEPRNTLPRSHRDLRSRYTTTYSSKTSWRRMRHVHYIIRKRKQRGGGHTRNTTLRDCIVHNIHCGFDSKWVHLKMTPPRGPKTQQHAGAFTAWLRHVQRVFVLWACVCVCE